MIRVKSITNTCSACPSQWEGITDDGKYVYIRYRWGALDISVAKSQKSLYNKDSTVYFGQHGDSLDGFMSYETLKDIARDNDIILPEEENVG